MGTKVAHTRTFFLWREKERKDKEKEERSISSKGQKSAEVQVRECRSINRWIANYMFGGKWINGRLK